MNGDEFVGWIMGTLLGAFLAVSILLAGLQLKGDAYWHAEIIKHGAGRYNQTTGAFEWLAPETGKDK